jgi:flavin-dependent dehydrogenase
VKPIGSSHDADIAVVGAGPAGIRAALTADRLVRVHQGLRVELELGA